MTHPLILAALSVAVHEPVRGEHGTVWNNAVRAAAKAVEEEMRRRGCRWHGPVDGQARGCCLEGAKP